MISKLIAVPLCLAVLLAVLPTSALAAADDDVIDADFVVLEDPAADVEELEPVEGEITEAQYRAYVLGFLTFFTVVLLAYFGYKFFAMFF